MSKISLLVCLFLTIILAFFFQYESNIDLLITQHFYLSQNTFFLETQTWANMSRTVLYASMWCVVGIIGFLFALRLVRPHLNFIPIKSLVYTLSVLILVPVILINGVFKDNFGRPRPRDITEFAGVKIFQPAWSISQQCSTNCSFVCGDSSAAFCFWLFLPFFKRRRYKLAYGTLVFLVGAFYGYIRIGQGAHFFSDVIFSVLLSYMGVWAVYAYYYLYAPKWANEERLKNSFISAHRFLFRF